jgi:hypothetical protein
MSNEQPVPMANTIRKPDDVAIALRFFGVEKSPCRKIPLDMDDGDVNMHISSIQAAKKKIGKPSVKRSVAMNESVTSGKPLWKVIKEANLSVD